LTDDEVRWGEYLAKYNETLEVLKEDFKQSNLFAVQKSDSVSFDLTMHNVSYLSMRGAHYYQDLPFISVLIQLQNAFDELSLPQILSEKPPLDSAQYVSDSQGPNSSSPGS
jgi:hypothetical protein